MKSDRVVIGVSIANELRKIHSLLVGVVIFFSQVPQYSEVVRKAGLTARVSIQSFDWRTLMAMKRIAPEIARACLTIEALNFDTIKRGEAGSSPWTAGLDIDDFDGSVPRLVQAAGCQVWSPLHRNARPDDVAAAKALGLKVIPWTVNERADMERLMALGVDGIITDYPDRLRAVMAEKGMPLPPAIKMRSR